MRLSPRSIAFGARASPVEGTKRDGKRERRDRAARARQWWEEMEQRSIRLALEYDYVWQTDITDCYGSLYTHSIAWAMHGKRKAKRCRRDPNMLGNAIDACMQDMKQGQTNGVPQGSLVVDLVVELVLCYADRKIGRKAKKAKIKDYRILRYRDDYRIFVNNPLQGEHLFKIISEVMYSLGLKLNAGKTKSSNDVLTSVIKEDKTDWNASVQHRKGLQRHISLIREFARKHPHSGSLEKALTRFEARLHKRRKVRNAHEMIAIVVDIAARNPRTYADLRSNDEQTPATPETQVQVSEEEVVASDQEEVQQDPKHRTPPALAPEGHLSTEPEGALCGAGLQVGGRGRRENLE